MNTSASKRGAIRERLAQLGALAVLLALGGLALIGPYGVLAWGENVALLQQRQERIAVLHAQREELENRVERLDPNNVDPDLATELIRRDLNVAHPDEYVIDLRQLR